MNYSVLMSVYFKENPKRLEEAILSIINQTILTNDFVIICDGPLTDSLYDVINKYKNTYDFFNIIKFEKNMGLGYALQQGVLHCKNEYIMRMDSDDVSLPNRADIQLKLIEKCDITSGTISEFEFDSNIIHSYRKLPITDAEIKRFIKKRSPFNHMATMFRKSAVLKAGNYSEVPYREDYDLWIKMINTKSVCLNTTEVLVNACIGNSMIERRFTREARKGTRIIRKKLLEYKLINPIEYIFYSFGDCVMNMMPKKIKKIVYDKFLRTK